ncbi:RING-type E3 ubiquitin-protein ligase PPIL2 isoform X3 [Carettochelys insculpta]|uniref:RING-type E3 ubiquitin-protein ligase PPIL2 isoform X3 n=1 Tax=Carettochelys insculpta TaxID=44489 RepID=UPI003EB81423
MGKRQHQKDKMYITCAEYTHFYGGKKADIPQANFRRLSFDHCSLSLQPFEYPVCTPDGTVFDLLSIVPWIKKYGTNPITGMKLDAKSLIKLNFAKNNEDKYHCPVLFTVFTNNSHIVAIKTTGNVYAYEAVEQLNIKPKNYKDLLTDEPFTRQDILTLQDPTNLDKFNVSNFFHVKNNLKVTDPDEEKAKLDPSYYLKNTNAETRETLLELYKEFKGDDILAATMKAPEKRKVDKLNAAHYSTGKVSASFTSTAMAPETTHEAAAIEEDVVRYQYVKKKGYVRLHTNKGDLNLELHCDMEENPIGENLLKMSSSQICPTLGVVFLAWPIQDPTATNHNSLSHFAPAHTWTRSTQFLDEWLVVLKLWQLWRMWTAIQKQIVPRRKYELNQQLFLLIHMKRQMLRSLRRERRSDKKRKRPKQMLRLSCQRKRAKFPKLTGRALGSILIWLQQNEQLMMRGLQPVQL